MDVFELIPLQMQNTQALSEVRECNEYSAAFGLRLSESAVKDLVAARGEALRNTGRVEFGGGILPKLIYAVCDSPFIRQDNYETTLAELQEAFYVFKNESNDTLTDDELIEKMTAVFNGCAQGCAELLSQMSVQELERCADKKFDPQGAEGNGALS